jgi:4-hydroxyphenylpyruvate dioxygenase
MSTNPQNYLGLDGIDFVEFASPNPQALHELFIAFGFSRTHKHKDKNIDLYSQNDITFFINKEPESFAYHFSKLHGPSACSMGWRVLNEEFAFNTAIKRGAKAALKSDFTNAKGEKLKAIQGIGDSLIYFVENGNDPKRYEKMGFIPHPDPVLVESKGFEVIDHLTNNVYKGTMKALSDFYKDVFGFTEVRYFDIRGMKTGLTSYALRSPCGKFCIPINEADEAKSQINEYLEEYRGPGIQHIALLTKNIIRSLELLKGKGIEMLDIEPDYYKDVFNRVPNVKEDHKRIQEHNILVDGDENGYLLQIFTKNVIGPIFFEIIQRENNLGFGEGNFTALFKSIERDQMKRGVL